MNEYRKKQMQDELTVINELCDIEDTSTEQMLQRMTDAIELYKLDYIELEQLDSHEFVMEYLYDRRYTDEDT